MDTEVELIRTMPETGTDLGVGFDALRQAWRVYRRQADGVRWAVVPKSGDYETHQAAVDAIWSI